MDSLKVKIADLAVLKGTGFLITIGLGSCVGIALYDEYAKVAGLAHVLLADSKQFSRSKTELNPAKFADTAIPVLIEKMELQGGNRNFFIAKIAGGSQLFTFNSTVIRVGDKNVEMARKKLKELSIPLIAEDVGGNYGRTMKIDVTTGKVYISTVGRKERVL